MTNTELITMLNATDSRWSAAVIGSQTAAGYILATDTAVMAIGGWSSDPSPTLAQFQQYVANGDIGYFIAGGGQGGGAGRSRWRLERHQLGDPGLGRGELHRHDGRRGDGVRPERGGELIKVTEPSTEPCRTALTPWAVRHGSVVDRGQVLGPVSGPG